MPVSADGWAVGQVTGAYGATTYTDTTWDSYTGTLQYYSYQDSRVQWSGSPMDGRWNGIAEMEAKRSNGGGESWVAADEPIHVDSYLVYKINGNTVYTSTTINSGTY